MLCSVLISFGALCSSFIMIMDSLKFGGLKFGLLAYFTFGWLIGDLAFIIGIIPSVILALIGLSVTAYIRYRVRKLVKEVLKQEEKVLEEERQELMKAFRREI